MSSLKQLNLFDILPGTLIQTMLATKTRYDNIADLYNLGFEVRWSLLDLLSINRISLRHGLVFSCGEGINGRLGDDNTSEHQVGTPSLIDYTYIGDRKIVQLAAGKEHSLFLCSDGSVFSCGHGQYGRLGNGDTSNHKVGTPSPIDYTYIGDRKIMQVSAGAKHSLFLCADGTVFSSGFGMNGRLGTGDTGIHEVGTPSPIDITYIGERKIVQVSAGDYHSLFLCKDGSIFSTGFGRSPVGIPSPIDRSLMSDRKVIQLSAGKFNSLFLCEDGSTFSYGYGVYGILGDGDTRDHYVEIPSPINTTNIDDRKVIKIETGDYHTLFLCEDGMVFSSGDGKSGVLADGDNSYHNVGTPSLIDSSLIGDRKVIEVSAGSFMSLFLCDDGSVFSCGNGRHGKLGDSDTSLHSVGTPTLIDITDIGDRKIVQVSAGYEHSLFLT